MQIDNKNSNISLRPSWYGKVNWSDLHTINPELAQYYDNRRNLNGMYNEYMGEYISPCYDERSDYIKYILDKNKIQDALDYEEALNNPDTNTTNTTITTKKKFNKYNRIMSFKDIDVIEEPEELFDDEEDDYYNDEDDYYNDDEYYYD